MNSRILAARLIALAALFAGGAMLPPSVSAETLRWKFAPDQTFEQTMVQEMKTRTVFGGQPIETSVSQTMDAQWIVGQIDNQGHAQVTQKINRIRMQMKMSGAGNLEANIDTDSDEAPQGFAAVLAPPLRALANSEFVLKMTPQGEILDVQISEDTIKELQNLPGAGQMGNLFSKESLINMIKQGTPPLPAGEVQQGDTWTHKMENQLPQLGTMAVTNELTYRGTEEIQGETLQRIDLKMNTDIAASNNPAVKISIKEQDAEGRMYFDNQAGHLSRSRVIQKMVMQLTTAGNTFDQNIEQTVTVTMKPGA